MPSVSIVLPTFNRADTILRAIRSVQTQSFQDWELIIVDDGSTDGTASLIADDDPRVTVIRQDNRGFTEARNAAIRAGRGDYFAFLDSDDEFLPHHLQLCVAFLDTYKDAQFISTELLEDFGHGRVVNHYRTETSDWYPKKAALIGSRDLDLPPGESDDYLRVYAQRQAIGDWGAGIISNAPHADQAAHYRGMIFEHTRYDFLITITATVIRRSAFEILGLPEPRWRSGSDFHFMARLCRAFPANFLSIPTFIKHEYSANQRRPLTGHVVTGPSALTFARDWQIAWEDLFWNARRDEPELRALRGLRHYWMAKIALQSGEHDLTLHYLSEALEGLPRLRSARTLYWFVRCMPGTALRRRIYGAIHRCALACGRSLDWLRSTRPAVLVLRKHSMSAVAPPQAASTAPQREAASDFYSDDAQQDMSMAEPE